jgi:type 1 glutamine amidotransferase
VVRLGRAWGGLIAIHWAIDNFRAWPGFTNILGRTRREGWSVEEHGSFHVIPTTDARNWIVSGMQPWNTVEAEAIHYRLRSKGDIDILATASSPKTQDVAAVMFAHRYGRGRTFFTPLGHGFASRADPRGQAMILRAAEWTATGSVRG